MVEEERAPGDAPPIRWLQLTTLAADTLQDGVGCYVRTPDAGALSSWTLQPDFSLSGSQFVSPGP
ncbi:MAG: hypothetical protein OXE86_17330 [Alphaproteobacteria bacterium]|nr:hypothetical protein [Alphaproteobacteria bacterium]